MPLYEFLCPTCGGITEVRRSMDERNALIFCDGTGAFDDPSAAREVEARGHDVVEMKRIMSRLAVARVAGKRYA